MSDPVVAELDPPFEILEPQATAAPFVFNSPHSGRVYPRAFLATARLDLATLRRSEDSFVDELVAGVVPRGDPLMRAHFPRCYVDVNREPYEGGWLIKVRLNGDLGEGMLDEAGYKALTEAQAQ